MNRAMARVSCISEGLNKRLFNALVCHYCSIAFIYYWFQGLYSLEYRMSGGGALDIHSMFRVSHQEAGWEVRMYMGALAEY